MFRRQREIITEIKEVTRLSLELADAMPDARERSALLSSIRRVTDHVACPHNESHVLAFIIALFQLDPSVEGAVVEAGCYKGGSTAKISLAVAELGRQLIVFDSFEGLPSNTEPHAKTIFGNPIEGWFERGNFSGGLDEVRANIAAYGNIEPCTFVPGWFEETMPRFDSKIAAAYVDVDLAASTRTCLKNLYPRLSPGGIIISQDGDFPLVLDVFRDEHFWVSEVGWPMPRIEGLGTKKILKIVKPAGAGPLIQ